MGSVAKGKLIVPVWCDDGEIKPIVDDSGLVPVTMSFAGLTFDVNLESSDITLNVNVIQGSGNIPVVIADCQVTLPVHLKGSDITLGVQLKGSDITLGVTESSPLASIQGQAYGWDTSSWRKNPIMWGFTSRLAVMNETTQSGGGNEWIDLYTVPTGYVATVQAIMSRNRDTITDQWHVLQASSQNYYVKWYDDQAIGLTGVNDNLSYALSAGDKVRVLYESCTNLDRLVTSCWGYLMKVDE